jgi:hypothetical protein
MSLARPSMVSARPSEKSPVTVAIRRETANRLRSDFNSGVNFSFIWVFDKRGYKDPISSGASNEQNSCN